MMCLVIAQISCLHNLTQLLFSPFISYLLKKDLKERGKKKKKGSQGKHRLLRVYHLLEIRVLETVPNTKSLAYERKTIQKHEVFCVP